MERLYHDAIVVTAEKARNANFVTYSTHLFCVFKLDTYSRTLWRVSFSRASWKLLANRVWDLDV